MSLSAIPQEVHHDDARNWASLGACVTMSPDALFVRGKEQRNAKLVCRGCPVVADCLAEALDTHTEFGVWGGMTERERRALLRRRPDVVSWQDVLCPTTPPATAASA